MHDEIRREIEQKLTVSLWPTTGKALGCGKGATYAGALRGEIPGAFRVGKKWRVATPPLREVLGLNQASAAA